jgi:hypothetical protein
MHEVREEALMRKTVVPEFRKTAYIVSQKYFMLLSDIDDG